MVIAINFLTKMVNKIMLHDSEWKFCISGRIVLAIYLITDNNRLPLHQQEKY